MSNPGQPKALDDKRQKTFCSLIAAGASVRQAAHFVDCDPKSIRREAERNDDFRCQLAKAKSEANIHPLQTLQRAAQTDWRAALRYMERLDPDRFARTDANVVTRRDANQFVAHLVESIERAVSSADERTTLFDLLTPAMPTPMRRPGTSAPCAAPRNGRRRILKTGKRNASEENARQSQNAISAAGTSGTKLPNGYPRSSTKNSPTMRIFLTPKRYSPNRPGLALWSAMH